MNGNKLTLEQLVAGATVYLGKLNYSESRLNQCNSAWNHLKCFMSKHEIAYYTASVGEAFIYDMMGNGPFQDLTRWEKQIASCVNVLTEFMETDSVKFKRSKVSRELSGPIGLTMREYIQHRKELGISISTEDEYRYHLEQVLNYLGSKSINTVSQISNCIIIDYANSMGFAPANTRSRNLSILKGYLRYLYESNKRGNCKTKCKPLPPRWQGPLLHY